MEHYATLGVSKSASLEEINVGVIAPDIEDNDSSEDDER
jgi:hypothetical protein